MKSKKFWAKKNSQSSTTEWVFSMEEHKFSPTIYCSAKQQLLWSEGNRNRAEPWPCGGSFPTKEQTLLAEGGVQGCSQKENSSGQCFGSGNSFHVTELSR